jgi:hypothetical protein
MEFIKVIKKFLSDDGIISLVLLIMQFIKDVGKFEPQKVIILKK